MLTIQYFKIIAVSTTIVAMIALFALLIFAGIGPTYILLAFLAMAAIAYVTYVLSDRLLIATIGASTRDVPAGIKSTIKQYCEQGHMPIPLVAVARQGLPDVYVDGIGKKKAVVVITSGAISNFTERELGEMAISEIGALEKYKTLDMAIAKLILSPINRINQFYIHRFCMRKDVTITGRLDEHTTFRKAEENDISHIYRIGFDAFNDTNGFVPLHNLAYRYRSPTSIIIMADHDGQPVGFFMGHIMRGSIGVYAHGDIMAVRKQLRRNGIGKGLFDTFLRLLEEHGCPQCSFEVWEQNRGAIKLQVDEGFTPQGIIKDFYKEGQNAYIMYKKIATQPDLPISAKRPQSSEDISTLYSQEIATQPDLPISAKRRKSSEEVASLCSQDMEKIKIQN